MQPQQNQTNQNFQTDAKNYFQSVSGIVEDGKDVPILLMTFTALATMVLIIIIITDIRALAVFAGIVLWTYFSIKLEQRRIIADGLRVQNSTYSYLNELVEEITTNLSVPDVDVVISSDLKRSAETLSTGRKLVIVLDDSLIADLNKEELRTVVVHQMGHIVFHNAALLSYIRRLSEKISIFGVGSLIEMFFGFWTRHIEQKSDRLALAYTRNSSLTISTIVKVTVGSTVAQLAQEAGLLYQRDYQAGIMRSIAEISSEKPFLVNRVKDLLDFAELHKIAINPQTLAYLHGTDGKPNA